MPPLRERRCELPGLIAEPASGLGVHPSFAPDTLEALLCWSRPFKVRELQALLQSCPRASAQALRDMDARLGLDWLRGVAKPPAAQPHSPRFRK